MIDLTFSEEHAQVISPGLLQHSRVLLLVWNVPPGRENWDQGFWDCIEELFTRLFPHLSDTEWTLIGDRAFGGFPLVTWCPK